MRILFIGDVTGEAGVRAVSLHLPDIRERYDLVIANAENATRGKGLGKSDYRRLREAGVDAITLGNHAFDNREVLELIEKEPILRAANYPEGVPGRRYLVLEASGKKLLLFQLMGRVFLEPNLDSPFKTADQVLAEAGVDAALIDFHAETTSEKYALFHYLNGRVSAIVGTHTHVPTADALVSERGTAYITDVGMTGPYDSIIGGDAERFLRRFLTAMPASYRAAHGKASLLAVEIELEGKRATNISPYRWDEP